MDTENQPCPGCQQMFAHIRDPEAFAPRYRHDFTLHETFDSFKSAVRAGCKLCRYARVSAMGHIADEDFFRAEDVKPVKHFMKVLLTWKTLPEEGQDEHMNAGEEASTPREAQLVLLTELEALPFRPRCPNLLWVFRPKSRMPEICMVRSTTTTSSDLQFFDRRLSECLKEHSQCAISHPPEHYPTRLLFVGTQENPCLRLTCDADSTDTDTGRLRYTALSHCWGRQTFKKLLRENALEWTTCIPEADLPRTFSEAIQVTRYFGLQFLWIDALCIIQDSVDDWSREAAKMADVYRGSYITIAATGARDSSEGLFPRSRPGIDPFITTDVLEANAKPVEYAFGDISFQHAFLNCEPLCARGWAVQERFLSARTLHFTSSQMLWECQRTVVCQTYPDGMLSTTQWQTRDKGSLRLGDHGSPDRASWRHIISLYARCQLTVPNDKLVALSGLASYFQPHMGCEYLAGLWTRDLASELLWRVVDAVESTRPAEYRAPSWSWASLDSPIGFIGTDTSDNFLVAIEDFGTVPASEDSRGQLRDAWINLRGYLINLTITLDSADNFDASLADWSSLEDIATEISSYPEVESIIAEVAASAQADLLEALNAIGPQIDIKLDASDVERILKEANMNGGIGHYDTITNLAALTPETSLEFNASDLEQAKAECQASTMGKAEVLAYLANLGHDASIVFDTSDLQQTFEADCKAGSRSAWWLPIRSTSDLLGERSRYATLSIDGLLLLAVPETAGGVFSRIGTMSLHLYSGLKRDVKTKIIQELFDRFPYKEPKLWERHPELLSRRSIRLV